MLMAILFTTTQNRIKGAIWQVFEAQFYKIEQHRKDRPYKIYKNTQNFSGQSHQ
jgi:hypothetical protein